MDNIYHPSQIEGRAQAFWQENMSFSAKEDFSSEKFYCLSMLPYPSGQLHMGHVRNYTIGDVIARYQRMLGKNVMQPMGWDAFGLPAENAALQHQLAPSEWTQNNIKDMRAQLKRIGFAVDWKREFATCDPDYYRWEQWLFVRLFKKGLVYQKDAEVNWDPVDQTVLANEQVQNGRGWRSGAEVERIKISQWFMRIKQYADELLTSLDTLDGWPEQVKTMQRHWIGRSAGLMVQFAVKDSDQVLDIFTTRADTLYGVTYLAIAAQHPLSLQAATTQPEVATFIESCKHLKVAEADMATIEKQGVATPFFAIHPITGQEIPIWSANFVLMEYGAGAVMSVPAHDQRDFEFAQKYQLPIRQVIKPSGEKAHDIQQGPFIEAGVMIDSEGFNGMDSTEANKALTDFSVTQGFGRTEVQFRLRDWGVSRQRYWGAPIPIIHCADCGAVPVPEKDLPVVLPTGIILKDPGSPLKKMPEFYEVDCPECGQPAKRETDTFDTFFESSWYYARYCSHDQDNAMLDDRAKYWTPVDQYVGGIEHAIMHLLYARFFHKLLRDEGLVNSDEPFTNLLTQGMVLKDGAKMSKSKGNTVAPNEFIDKYGADTVRLFTIFAAPPEQSLDWKDTAVEGPYRFLKRLWANAAEHHAAIQAINVADTDPFDWQQACDDVVKARKIIHENIAQAKLDMGKLQLNTVASAAMKIQNVLAKIKGDREDEKALLHQGYSLLIRLLAPITPHICHELWINLKYGHDVSTATWPKADNKAMKTSAVELIVQINGKRRSSIQVSSDADKSEIEAIALKDEKVQEFITDQPVKKLIVVPNRLVNIVI